MNNKNYNEFLTKEYLMGPSSLETLEEMLGCAPKGFGRGRMLDLGCGRGITSLYLARETQADAVFAADLWISAAENYRSIIEWGEERRIIPLHSDAADLPFAEGYFDAIVSVDAYHYFGCTDGFFAEKIFPLLAPGGCALIAVPGVKEEAAASSALMLEWAGEDAKAFHSCDWWRRHIAQGVEDADITVQCSTRFDAAWNGWFRSGHEYASADKSFFDRGLGDDLCFVIIIVKKNG